MNRHELISRAPTDDRKRNERPSTKHSPGRVADPSELSRGISADRSVPDISVRTELQWPLRVRLFPIEVVRELPALDLWFHLRLSADAP
jgi:hypothetical protein